MNPGNTEHDRIEELERISLTRRELLARGGRATLALAGVGALASIGGCGGANRRRGLSQLAHEVSGPVSLPGDRGYAAARLLFNRSFDALRPRAIVFCETARDVAATVNFARRHGIRLAARSGRHSFGGYSSPEGGIVADLSQMKHIQIAPDRRTARVGPGVINMDMYAKLGGAGLAIPGGTCPTVGLGGLTLGGGFGYSSRQLGLTADNLLEIELVLASGERVTCSQNQNPDLFWACRGGGGGNFGIATSFRYRLHPVGAVSVYQLSWRWSDALAVVDAWQRWAPDAPDALFSTCLLSRTGGRRPEGPTITSQGQYFGSASQLSPLLGPLQAAAAPVHRMVASQSFVSAQEIWAGCSFQHCERRSANPYTVKSAFFSELLPSRAIEIAIDQLERWPGSVASAPPAAIELNSWGGAIARVSNSATAFVHRDARFLAIYGTSWSQHDNSARVAANRAWLGRFYTMMAPYASGYAYQNLIDPQLSDWAHAYYGSNLSRLVAVKRRYDPDNVFRFPQGIPMGS